MVRRALLVVTTIIAIVVTASGTASAHADLISTTPTNQSVLDDSPTEIVLTFSEAIDPVEPAVRVVDADGNDVDTEAATQAGGDDTLTVTVDEPLDDGSYVVAWQVVSLDAHDIRGTFTFSVGETSTTRTGQLDEVFASDNSSPGGAGLLGTGRSASYAGIAVVLGGLFAVSIVAGSMTGSRRVGVVLWAGLAVALLGTATMIAAQANLIGSSPVDWGAVGATRSGRWWLVRLVGIAVLAPVIHGRRILTTLLGRLLGVGVGVVVLGVVAAGGHAVTGRWIPVGYAATIVHLAAMAVWVGGLAVLGFGLKRGDLAAVANRFSPWALGSVAALVASGSVNAWRQIGRLDGITESSYGRWLIVKIAIVASVVVAAAISRRLLHRTAHSATDAPLALSAASLRAADTAEGGAERLRQSVLIEIAGIVLVVAATSGLVDSPPPELNEPTDQLVSTVRGDRVAQVELEPATTGGTVMHVRVTSTHGGLERADEIAVTAELESEGLGPIEIDTIPASPDHVIADNADFPVPGIWTIEITARYGEFDQIVFDVDIPVES